MSDFMKILLKEFSQDLSSLHSKIRDVMKKNELDSRIYSLKEVKTFKDQAQEKVYM